MIICVRLWNREGSSLTPITRYNQIIVSFRCATDSSNGEGFAIASAPIWSWYEDYFHWCYYCFHFKYYICWICFFDNTIQVDLMLMQIHPIILFLSDLTVDGTNTDTGSIATNSTMMILCCWCWCWYVQRVLLLYR